MMIIHKRLSFYSNTAKITHDTVEELGRMIVICYDAFTDVIDPYVNWKNQKGIPCVLYTTSEVGTSSTTIKSFIQDQYDLGDGLTFVQLVGDNAQVPTYNGDEDPSYSLLEGTDSYPEIFIGRFSGTSDAHIETQIERTIHYERDISSGSWLNEGLGIASAQGTGDQGEYDDEHMDVIRDKLLAYTYTDVDREYDSNGGSVGGAMNTLNAGCSITNYCGHGSITGWANGAPLNNTYVNNLENDNTLPFIFSVACVVGNFMNNTCFAETWLRATNNSTGNPTGAIAFYGSTINQSWSPPMRGQDHINDLLVGWNYYTDSAIDQKFTYGGLCFNGSCNMMDVYGSSGANEFKHWTIFGDASLMVRTDEPGALVISHDPNILTGNTSFTVSTGVENSLVCLYNGSDIIGSGYANGSGDVTLTLDPPPSTPLDLTLTVTAYNKATHVATVPVINSAGPYVTIDSYSVSSDGDDVIEAGEIAFLTVTLYNNGSATANNVGMTISESNSYITIIDGTQSFGSLPADGMATENNAFSFSVAADIPDNHPIHFDCLINSDEDSWNYEIDLTASNPPAINFSPSFFEETLLPEETSSQDLIVGNTGGGALIYNVSIEDVVRDLSYPINTNDTDLIDYNLRDYCTASGGCDEYVSRVQVGDIDNSSACSGHADYTAVSTDMTIGTGYDVTLTISNPYLNDTGGLWIDWNQDADFEDAGEAVIISWTGSGPYSTTIIPPEYALTGETRMRVRLTYNTTPSPCGSTTYGEVEDYTINVMSNGPEWLTLNGGSEVNDSVPAGAVNDVISVGFNTTGLAGGIYTANIIITSNDPDDPSEVIPVTLNVESTPDTPANVQLEITGANIIINWDPVAEANSYMIYSSSSPDGPFDLLEIVSSAVSTRSYLLVEEKQFFRIVASTESAPE